MTPRPTTPGIQTTPTGLLRLYFQVVLIAGGAALTMHVLIGVVLLTVCASLILTGRIRPGNDVVLENSGLYWHLVDLIWIFIFPLFYLIL